MQPTRGDNTLELLLTSEEEMVENIEVGETFGSSDDNYITRTIVITRELEGTIQKYMDWKRANWGRMKEEIKQINWDEEFKDVRVQGMWNIFTDSYNQTMKRNVPV